jgi:PTH1 family peptidyl-tRNA hydrolase
MKFLIAGLGNIGDEYANTRHNIGFIIADALALDGRAKFEPGRHADVAKRRFKGRTLVIIKPTTFMNLSGKAIRYWLNEEKIPADKLLVMVDDIALPLGTLRVRRGGGDGGHNGLTSTIEYLESADFPRLRVGIGDDFARGYQSDYVLGKWTRKEEEIMVPRVKEAVEAVKSFVTVGLEKTMNLYN